MSNRNKLRDVRHLTEQELLQLLDNELPAAIDVQVQTHYTACEDCQTRFAKLVDTSQELLLAQREALNPQIPAAPASRSKLQARLRETTANLADGLALRPAASRRGGFTWAYCVAAILLMAVTWGTLRFTKSREQKNIAAVSPGDEPIPDRRLTPGATITATKAQICRMRDEDQVQVVSVALSQKVFQEYGLPNARSEDYEVDYLITPGLGGSGDIRNLWPEPYFSTVWNAKVKDELEDRLREMVCAGELDLSTAQRDIATDWISAYKKYFHTNRPIPAEALPVVNHPRS